MIMAKEIPALDSISEEKHPLQPFIPFGARLLMLGSFPPPRHRWSIEFFYPNIQNDMWKIFGYIYYADKDYFYDVEKKQFRKLLLIDFLTQQHIALYDTATCVRRLRGNAADQFLEIVEETDVRSLLQKMPEATAIACTGQKSAEVVINQLEISMPKIGEYSIGRVGERQIKVWRMPSSSRSYPLALTKKAIYYEKMLKDVLGDFPQVKQ